MGLMGWAGQGSKLCKGVASYTPSCFPLSLNLLPPAHTCARKTPRSADLSAQCCGSSEMTDVNVLWECEGYTNVSYTNLPSSPWPPSRRLFNSLGPRCVRRCFKMWSGVHEGTVEQATNISAGRQTRLRFLVEKAGIHN